MRNPPNVDEVGGYTKISMFFNTVEDDGFLAYFGPKGVVSVSNITFQITKKCLEFTLCFVAAQ